MKKTAIFLLVLSLLLCLGACSKREKSGVAFICGPAGIEERFEGQALRTAVYNYCTEHKLPFYEYISDGKDGYYSNAASAASALCDIIVCDSHASAEVAPKSSSYDTSFLFVNYSGRVGTNARAVSICEEDAAFLAGYAAVLDGNDKIAFLGGEENDMNKRYLYGFIQGIVAAAGHNIVEISYGFTGEDEASDETKSLAQSVFMDGYDIMFVCGSNIYKSAVQAANVTKKFLIGGEMDQAGESERFITAATKKYGDVIGAELNAFFGEKAWSGDFAGASVLYRYSNGAVGLPEYNGAFRFSKFTHEDLDALKEKLDSGLLTVERGTGIPQLPETIVANRISIDK